MRGRDTGFRNTVEDSGRGAVQHHVPYAGNQRLNYTGHVIGERRVWQAVPIHRLSIRKPLATLVVGPRRVDIAVYMGVRESGIGFICGFRCPR